SLQQERARRDDHHGCGWCGTLSRNGRSRVARRSQPDRPQAGDGCIRPCCAGAAEAQIQSWLSGRGPMIEIERLEKTFTQPGGAKVLAPRGIDLVIPSG